MTETKQTTDAVYVTAYLPNRTFEETFESILKQDKDFTPAQIESIKDFTTLQIERIATAYLVAASIETTIPEWFNTRFDHLESDDTDAETLRKYECHFDLYSLLRKHFTSREMLLIPMEEIDLFLKSDQLEEEETISFFKGVIESAEPQPA